MNDPRGRGPDEVGRGRTRYSDEIPGQTSSEGSSEDCVPFGDESRTSPGERPHPPADALLDAVAALGCAVAVRRGRLRVRPGGRLPAWLRSRLREAADDVVATLQDRPPAGPCPACGGRLFVYAARGVPSCVACFGVPQWVPERWCWFLEDLVEPVEREVAR